jgi:hypothetical protein
MTTKIATLFGMLASAAGAGWTGPAEADGARSHARHAAVNLSKFHHEGQS